MENSGLLLPIFSNTSSIEKFLKFWSQFYPDKDADYIKNIDEKQFERKNILELYKWKNNVRLSNKKEKSVENKIVSQLELINKLKKSDLLEVEVFNERFEKVSAVWRIFLLHIIKPEEYPIYDQHVHRTFQYIHGLPFTEISNNMKNKDKLKFYFEEYKPFFNSIVFGKRKKIDEAFWAFGKFLKANKINKLID